MNPSRRRFLRRLAVRAAVAGVGVGTLGYATLVEPYWVEVVEHDLPIANLPAALDGELIVQVSDLHYGSTDAAYLHGWLARLADRAPAVVALTGDFTTAGSKTGFADLARGLDRLARGRLLTVAVLGNHDHGRMAAVPDVADETTRVLEAAGVTVLRNATVDVAGLHVMGLDDFWAQGFKPWLVVPKLPPGVATLALSHNPESIDSPYWSGYAGWLLSGHTHGGQCRVPGFAPPFLPLTNRTYVAGDYTGPEGRRVYVNRGLGHLRPARFCVRPEVTVHTLRRA